MRKTAIVLGTLALLGVLMLFSPSADATTYSTITATKTYVGTDLLLYKPCENGRGPSAEIDLRGGCLLLPTEHPGTLVSIGIDIGDVTGKQVAGRYELISWDCYPGIGCGWGQSDTGDFCFGSTLLNVSPNNSATHLQITLNSQFFTLCPRENFGTTGQINVTFTYQSP